METALSKETLAMIQQVRAKSAEYKGKQSTEDILNFIRSHYVLFCGSKQEMESAIKTMDQSGSRSVGQLADLLGLPETVHFMRVKTDVIQRMLLNFPKSSLFDVFMKCITMHASAEALLFAVSGESTYVITNMQTDYEEGGMHLFYKSSGRLPDIHIFPWRQAPSRLYLFRHNL